VVLEADVLLAVVLGALPEVELEFDGVTVFVGAAEDFFAALLVAVAVVAAPVLAVVLATVLAEVLAAVFF
jgi:hypothetical protein